MYNGQFTHFLPEDLAHVTVSWERQLSPQGGLPEMLLKYWFRGRQPSRLSQEANHKIGKQASWGIFTIFFSVKQTQLQNPENVFPNSLIFIYFQDTRVSIILLLSSVNSFPWGLKLCLLSIINAQSYPYSILHGWDGKESACNARDPGSIPGSGRSPGERNGNPLPYSCQENSKDRGSCGLQSMGLQRVRQN